MMTLPLRLHLDAQEWAYARNPQTFEQYVMYHDYYLCLRFVYWLQPTLREKDINVHPIYNLRYFHDLRIEENKVVPSVPQIYVNYARVPLGGLWLDFKVELLGHMPFMPLKCYAHRAYYIRSSDLLHGLPNGMPGRYKARPSDNRLF